MGFFEVIGWLGAAFLLAAYFALSYDLLRSRLTYHGLNVAGALGLAINAWHDRTYPAMFVNVVWVVIAGTTLLRPLCSRNRAKNQEKTPLAKFDS